MTTERKLKRRSYTKYLWNSKVHDHHKEAFRFVKDSDMSPQVTSIVEKLEGVLHPSGKRIDGNWTYQTRGNIDLMALAGNATVRCKADFQSETIFSHYTPTIQVFGLMKENSLSLSLFSLNGLNLILEASRCLFS